jgi:redox-sensing transcriptional repressor
MGWQMRTDAVLVGAGRLGSALIGYPGFKEQGFQIVAAFDVKPSRNQTVSGVPVYPVSQLCERVKELKVSLGILTVPDAFAQDVADALIAGGVRGIWNFTPVRLKVPEGVIVKREDLAASLALLSYRLHQDEDLVK